MTEQDTYRRLPALLEGARASIEVWSAFVARRRLELVLPMLAAAVEIRDGRTNSNELLALLRTAGVEVVEDFGTHEKALLIDDEDGYYGSLNLLSHGGETSELMIHLSGKEQATAFRQVVLRRPGATARAPSRR